MKKNGLRKMASSKEGAVSVDKCTEDWVVPLSWGNQIYQSQKEGAGYRGLEVAETPEGVLSWTRWSQGNDIANNNRPGGGERGRKGVEGKQPD